MKETSVIDLVGDISFAETDRFTKNIEVLNQPKNIILEAEIVRVSTPVRQKKTLFFFWNYNEKYQWYHILFKEHVCIWWKENPQPKKKVNSKS